MNSVSIPASVVVFTPPSTFNVMFRIPVVEKDAEIETEEIMRQIAGYRLKASLRTSIPEHLCYLQEGLDANAFENITDIKSGFIYATINVAATEVPNFDEKKSIKSIIKLIRLKTIQYKRQPIGMIFTINYVLAILQ